MPSIHDSSAANAVAWTAPRPERQSRPQSTAAGGSVASTGPRLSGTPATEASATGTVAVAIGCLSAPAKTVTSPSRSIRTLSSAPTKLRLRARMWPLRRLSAETCTSAFGALATTAPSASRTTMSRIRTAVPPFSVRSIWVPPTSTWSRLPKFSSMAEASHGVKASICIGPLSSRHQSPRKATRSQRRGRPAADADAPDQASMTGQQTAVGAT